MILFSPSRTKAKWKKKEKKYALARSFWTQKRPHFVFRRNKVFSVFLIQKIQSQNKDFYPKMDELAMREHSMTLQF